MTTAPTTLTIAPPGAVCRVCGGACDGQWTQVGPCGWYVHLDMQECVRAMLVRIGKAQVVR